MLEIQTALTQLPCDPGVYLFYNSDKQVIYVGKAVNLKNRIRSYFQNSTKLGPKTQALVANIAYLKTIKVESEIEALLLEAELIKRYQPRYNIVLKDDKSSIYIKISTNEDFPRICTVRREQEAGATYFGPYPSAATAKQVLRLLRRIFPYRSCAQLPQKPCLYYHLRLCDAPCSAKISQNDYAKRIRQIITFLQGKQKQLVRELKKEMIAASKALLFEEAAALKKQLDAIRYVTQTFKNPHAYIENPNLLEDERQKILDELAEVLTPYFGRLESLARIECYDISNIQGTNAVGAMTVAQNAVLSKKDYRKFKIRTGETPDDFRMHQEVLRRRLQHEEWPIPNLIVIDGGKGQVSAASRILAQLGKEIPLLGLAKKQEEIIVKVGNNFASILLPRNSKALQLLQQLRDEAHRFGITYHRQLRNKKTFK